MLFAEDSTKALLSARKYGLIKIMLLTHLSLEQIPADVGSGSLFGTVV